MRQFQLVDYIPWIGSVLAELLLVAIMLLRGSIRSFPLFFTSVAYDLSRQAALAAIASRSLVAHSYAFWISVPIEYVIAFAVMMEAFRHFVGADHRIPSKTLRLLAVLTVLLVAVAAYLVLHPDIPTSNLTGMVLTLDRSIELLCCGVLLLIWTFASQFGITWRHHVWGVVFGLGVYSATGLVVAAIQATTGIMCGDWLARLQPFSYLGVTIFWTVHLRRPEPERRPLTLDELFLIHYLLNSYRKVLAELRRLLFDGNSD